jgi:hypothetical protein
MGRHYTKSVCGAEVVEAVQAERKGKAAVREILAKVEA